MFLAALARPRFGEDGELLFDGKIGIWPIVTYEMAQHASQNHSAGTIIAKPRSLSRSVYREVLLEHVLPAIKQKWPSHNKNIILQQDGAKAHILENDAEFMEHATTGNWNI